MRVFLRSTILAALALAVLSGTASAERVFTVDNATTGVFDQASTVVSGTTVHVAYLGGASTAGPFLVHYAAMNGSADFNLSLQRSQYVVTAPVVVEDNVGGGDAYVDARHPRIALRTSKKVVVVFQGMPEGGTQYVAYRAILTLENDSVQSVSVRQVKTVALDLLPATDIAVALDSVDNTARLAYSAPVAPGVRAPVYYARAGLDNATVVDSPLLLTTDGSRGVLPLPAIALDSSRRAHVVWSAAPDNGTTPAEIYYAMVKAGTTGLSGTDNVAIGATPVFQGGRKWAFPAVAAASKKSVFVLAGDASLPGLAGDINWVELNPEADNQDGTPVDNIALNLFRIHGPGTASQPLYRPDIVFDATGSTPIFLLTGYGISETAGSHFAMSISSTTGTSNAISNLSTYPGGTYTPPGGTVGHFVFPVELDDDYTRPAAGFLNKKSMVFWSGLDPDDGSVRHLYVTTIFSGTRPPRPASESGCSAGPYARKAGATEIGGVVVLLLPAILLGARRFSRIPGPRRGDVES